MSDRLRSGFHWIGLMDCLFSNRVKRNRHLGRLFSLLCVGKKVNHAGEKRSARFSSDNLLTYSQPTTGQPLVVLSTQFSSRPLVLGAESRIQLADRSVSVPLVGGHPRWPRLSRPPQVRDRTARARRRSHGCHDGGWPASTDCSQKPAHCFLWSPPSSLGLAVVGSASESRSRCSSIRLI